ncbi:hypothetical protein [Campylobacter devanensis]|uniref:hypothetical protein n=1 Tax=Campylobacter devanensis TaxID=3161138 RepID=UPI001F1DF63C|nr:hypothetical protein [Campylobacter sp. P093]
MPVAGSFHEYGSRFISSSFGFAIGWNYWFNWVITVAAGEAKNPNRSIPKAINAIFWRILLFYIFVIFIIDMLLPFTDPNLLKNIKTDIAQSHFTILFDRAGVAFAASVMNAVIFTAIFSAINSAKPTSLKAKISMIYYLKQNGTYLNQF